MNKLAVFMVFVAFVLTTLNCNACYEVPPIKKGTGVIESNRDFVHRERGLLQYINDRTVLVEIHCAKLDPGTLHPVSKYKRVGWGTGVILASMSGFSYIQTAWHVVDEARLMMHKGEPYDCSKVRFYRYTMDNKIRDVYKDSYKIVHHSVSLDVALIKVYRNYGVSTTIARRPLLGQEVRIMGFPGLRGMKGSNLSVERGVVGSVNLRSERKKVSKPIRIAAAIYYGNSGGGVWSITGELVGTVNYMIGWGVFGVFITQQNCAYGLGSDVLRIFYSQKGMNILLY